MSKFDENLFGRIAVLNNYVDRRALEECLEIQRAQGFRQHLGHILLDRGYLTREQFRHIADIRKKKVKKLLRKQEQYLTTDREFGKLLLEKRLVDLDLLEAAVLEQQQLRRLNLHFNLVEVLVGRRHITAAVAKQLLALLGRSVLRCPLCDVQYRVIDLRDDGEYQCPRCRSALAEPAYLDPLLVDGVVEAVEFESTGEVVPDGAL